MLSDYNIRKINEQITSELRIADSYGATHAEKMEAFERVAKLQALLNPQPSRTDILQELATAFAAAQQPTKPVQPSGNGLIADLIAEFRR